MTQPDNRFLPGPAYHPPVTLARPAQVPAPLLPPPLVAPPAVVHLTVRRNGDVNLRKSLLALLPQLRPGSPVDLVPPMRRGGTWHLDTRTSAPRHLPADIIKGARFTIAALSAEHFLAPAVESRPGHFGGLKGAAGVRPLLAFALGPAVEGHPGHYALRPLRENGSARQ